MTAATVVEDLTGRRVVSWWDDSVVYAGPDTPGMTRYTFDLRTGGSTLSCDPDCVAPVDAVDVPKKDPRVDAVRDTVYESKGGTRPYGAGPWRLYIDGAPTWSWYRTKGDAIAAGCRRVAIAAWWAGRDGGAR